MDTATAKLKTYRQSPRKVRVVADLIRGKRADEALDILTFVPKRAGLPLRKLLASAIANAKQKSLGPDLVVKEVRVDAGQILYRSLPMAHGRAFRLRKRTSHVSLTVAPSSPKASKGKPSKKAKTKTE